MAMTRSSSTWDSIGGDEEIVPHRSVQRPGIIIFYYYRHFMAAMCDRAGNETAAPATPNSSGCAASDHTTSSLSPTSSASLVLDTSEPSTRAATLWNKLDTELGSHE